MAMLIMVVGNTIDVDQLDGNMLITQPPEEFCGNAAPLGDNGFGWPLLKNL